MYIFESWKEKEREGGGKFFVDNNYYHSRAELKWDT